MQFLVVQQKLTNYVSHQKIKKRRFDVVLWIERWMDDIGEQKREMKKKTKKTNHNYYCTSFILLITFFTLY
jgi:hypothetical protein